MQNVEAIVLAFQKRNDSSSLLHLYTREYGRIAVVVYGAQTIVSRKNKPFNKSLFSPLSWLDVIVRENHSEKSIYTLHSASYHYIPNYIHIDIKRQCVAIYIAEVLYKSLRHPLADEQVFDYITSQIKEIDSADSIGSIPLNFIVQLSGLLGYGGEIMEEIREIKSAELVEDIL